MPSYPIPSIDNSSECATWTPQDRDLYNKQDFYFVKAGIKQRQRWETWSPLLGTFNWEANKGHIARTVMVENTPVLRQLAKPQPITSNPQVDVIGIRERTTDASIGWHHFVSPHFNFLPSFVDFMKGNLEPARSNIETQMMVYEEQFYRAHMLGWAPYVYIAGYGMVDAPAGDLYFTNAANGSGTSFNNDGKKNAGWWQEVLKEVKEPLSYRAMKECAEIAMDEIGTIPFQGDTNGAEGPLNESYLVVTNSPTYLSLVDDPWLTENRRVDLDIVNAKYKPTPFGNIKLRCERYGMRMKTDANYLPFLPVPETYDADTNSVEYNRTRPNPVYSRQSQISVSWFVGDIGYDKIKVGAPPAQFAQAGIPGGFQGMKWNGEIYSTKNFLVSCLDSNGNLTQDTNSWNHYLRLQAEAVFGIRGRSRHNIIPILHLTRKGQLRTAMGPTMGNQPVSQVIVNP